ncbi:type II secretion system protein GspN [Vitiosangium sp. GDMCC 1.1324]|uniref:type II secretion system protein GspN n=1 Tax=Vitiosangium sp. (strain GDMCC 1.1324) TaxID=2138576 RepID=UPI000D3723DD|nr:type II secretion system protein GspN [Vitiosangium sp. GDMCC 1.1324]PTL80441.1 type II secretion system protein GspN [Vitiosangium sp. GDMCC 1.1324]
MAAETKIARWKLALGYGAFSLVAFVLCLFLTFPYDTLRRRAVDAAADAGYALRIGSLRPGLRGLTATQVRISKVPNGMTPELHGMLASNASMLPGPEELGEPLNIDSVAVRPSLLPLGVAFHAGLLGGSISGNVGGLSDVQVSVKLSDLDPSGGNLKGFSGMDLTGKLNGSLNLTLPKTRGQPDLSQANGQLTLDSKGLLIQGGNITVPMYGQPTPMDLPKIALGDIDARIKIEKGQGTVEALQAKSEDLEIQGSGTVKLGQRLDVSQPDMDFKLRAEPEFVKRLGLLGAGLSILPADKTDPKFRVAHLSGFFNRPTFGPARQQPQMH